MIMHCNIVISSRIKMYIIITQLTHCFSRSKKQRVSAQFMQCHLGQSLKLLLFSVYYLSLFWDYAVTVYMEEIVYLHCHQQCTINYQLLIIYFYSNKNVKHIWFAVESEFFLYFVTNLVFNSCLRVMVLFFCVSLFCLSILAYNFEHLFILTLF